MTRIEMIGELRATRNCAGAIGDGRLLSRLADTLERGDLDDVLTEILKPPAAEAAG